MATAHTLVSGSFPALEPAFLDEVARRQAGDPLRVVEVLVGSNLLALYLRRRAAERFRAVAGLRFLTFLDLARLMTRESDPRPALPALGEELLARRALSVTPLASRFGRLRERDSLARAVAGTAADLRSAGVGPFELLKLADGGADRRERLEALSAVLTELESLRARFSDPDLLLEQAARNGVARDDQPLLVYGLYELGSLREALLKRLAAQRPIVAFVPEDGRPDELTPPVRTRLFEALLGVGATALAPGSGPLPPRMVLARDETDEARETVRELIAAVESGIPLHRTAVLLRRPEVQEAPIVAELKRAGIPYFRPPGPGFAGSALGRAARLFLEAAGTGLGARTLPELVDLLEGLDLLPSGITPGHVRAAFQELGPVEGTDAVKRRLARRIERQERARRLRVEEDDGRTTRAIERLRAVAAAVARLEPILPPVEPASFAVWGERLRDGFAALAIGHADAPRLAAAADAIGALEAVEPRARLRLDEVQALLPGALDLEPVRHGLFERSGVALLTSVSARGLSFDAVLLPGLVEALFPAASRPDPLLPDVERERLGLPLRAGPRQAREERFLFELALAAGRRRVVLLAARRDAIRERDRILSPFLLEGLDPLVAAAPDGAAFPPAARRPAIGLRVHEGPPLDEAEALGRSLERAPERTAVILSTSETLDRVLLRARARRRPGFTAYEGNVGRPSPLSDLAAAPLSASRLENLAICPYRFFLGDVLALAPREPLERPLDAEARERGTLVHTVLRDLARAAGAEGRTLADLSPEEGERRVDELSTRLTASWSETGELDLPAALLDRVRQEVASAARAALAHERERRDRTLSSEVELGFDDVSAGPFRFRGRIDRVDRTADGLRVIDYKVGAPTPYEKTNRDGHLIARGERLQLPIYALAARALLDPARPQAGDPAPVTSEYLFIRPDLEGHAVIPRSFDAAETDASVATFGAFLSAVNDLTTRGLFLPKTTSLKLPDPCARCPFAPVCGPGHQTLYARKEVAGDPDLLPLLAMQRCR